MSCPIGFPCINRNQDLGSLLWSGCVCPPARSSASAYSPANDKTDKMIKLPGESDPHSTGTRRAVLSLHCHFGSPWHSPPLCPHVAEGIPGMTLFPVKCQGRLVFKPAGLDQQGTSRLRLEHPKLAVLRCQPEAWAALGPSAFRYPASRASQAAPGPATFTQETSNHFKEVSRRLREHCAWWGAALLPSAQPVLSAIFYGHFPGHIWIPKKCFTNCLSLLATSHGPSTNSLASWGFLSWD